MYEKEKPKFAVDFDFTAKRNNNVSLGAECGSFAVCAESDFVPREALNKPLTLESAENQLSKTGGTQFYIGKIKCDIDEGVNVPVSVINNLRRDALDLIEDKICEGVRKECGAYSPSVIHQKADDLKIICRFADEERVMLGDANGDGSVDIRDVTAIQRHASEYQNVNSVKAADVDGNNAVDVQDATSIQRYLAEYEVEYSIGESI